MMIVVVVLFVLLLLLLVVVSCCFSYNYSYTIRATFFFEDLDQKDLNEKASNL